jgi:lipocalin-like protein
MRGRISAIVVLLVVGASIVARSQTPSLEGAWRVTEVVVTGDGASTNKTPQPGLYLFTKKHYSLITVNSTSPRKEFGAPKDPAKLTDAEKMARYEAWNDFSANSGTYEVKGNHLTTRPIVAKNPSVMTGPGQTREFKIDGKMLTLIQTSAAGQPASETRTTLTRVE